MISELYQYRELLKTSIKKEIRGKYKASFLGVLWSFINPLLQVLVYAIVFPYMMRDTGDDYIIYLVTGILPWTFFQTVINECVISVKKNSGIIKKVYFPRVILPLSSAISGLINFFISCLIILFFCLIFKVGFSWHFLYAIPLAIIECVLALGIGLALGAVDAYVQDLEYIVNFILMMAFYGSPIVYQMSLFESNTLFLKIIQLNPMTKIIMGYRDAFLYHVTPPLTDFIYVSVIACIVLVLGYMIFKKLEKGFAEQF
ncbi:ABC transporter permease [Bulleidia sp. HCP3S3_F2]|jgi:lipopolysaccharide transport system permease protein|uniref:ABC transporter permease n=1 Tax=unclassified Bulleidia TaxID=2704656 RepID=UPI003F8AB20D